MSWDDMGVNFLKVKTRGIEMFLNLSNVQNKLVSSKLEISEKDF